MPITIRDAESHDMDDLVTLLHELFSIEADFCPDRERQRRGLALMLAGCRKHRCVKVAAVDGRVVGMCTAQILVSTAEGSAAALVEDMIVLGGHRRAGIGRRLILAVERWAVDHDAHRLQLLADRNNTQALAFYGKNGWRPTQLVCLRKRWIRQ